MKKILLLLITAIFLTSSKRAPQIDVEYIAKKFKEHADKIYKVEYSIQRIDSFPQKGAVWNTTGVALIEKHVNDKTFGFSFYGKRDDIPSEYIYDKGVGFEIAHSTKNYRVYKGSYGFLGAPGGQMIPQNIFRLDSVYKSRTLIENGNRYILKYEYQNDTVHNVTEIVKLIELTKDNFFPLKVTRTSKALGNRQFSQTVLSNVKINERVLNSIEGYKNGFKDYDLIQPEEREPNQLIGKSIPTISLPGVLDHKKILKLPIGKPILIDFWEPWCGPCVVSFPKIENLKKKYSSQLEIVGIVSNDEIAVTRLITAKNITFLNLVGNKDLIEQFSIDSWPTYFLIDKNGIVQKEYFGFSEQIEKDIKAMLVTQYR